MLLSLNSCCSIDAKRQLPIFAIPNLAWALFDAIIEITHKKMYHGTLTMYHGTLSLYHGIISYGKLRPISGELGSCMQ